MANEFLQILCNFYIVATAVLLPLYVRGTYVMLGDDKYMLFRSVSLICLGFGMAAVLAKVPVKIHERMDSSDSHVSLKCGRASLKWGSRGKLSEKSTLNPVDVCMMLYGITVVISALCSSYGEAAWTGYREWYMGAVSQLIFVGTYFFISRCYRGDGWPILLLEASFLLVTVLGFCSRLGMDPLGLMDGFDTGDWEYSHLVSTIGNINWFCGYCAVALAMPVSGFLRGKHPRKVSVLYIISVLGLLLLCIQGSDIGPVLVIACLGVCLLWSRGKMEEFGRTLLLAAGVAFGLPCYSGIVRRLGEKALKSLPADGPGLSLFSWVGWWLIGILCLGLYLFLHRPAGRNFLGKMRLKKSFEETDYTGRQDSVSEHVTTVKGLWLGIVVLAAVAIAVGGALYLWRLSGSRAWQNGRGALWQLALHGFWRGDWKQKLLGAGPDCFAEYMYSVFAPSELFVPEDYWSNAVFANAHNQWLNHLVNIGMLGISCVVGLAITAAKRYRRSLAGVLVLTLYGVNSMVSFQQVLSTPLFFVLLGICEYRIRKDSGTGREKVMHERK